MQYLLGCALLFLTPVVAFAQDFNRTSPPAGARVATFVGGFGNTLGGFGAQGEVHLGHERFSVFGGAGFVPSVDRSPAGVTVAGGVRGFTKGTTHRGFLEVSISPVAIETGGLGQFLYGPGIQAGWQYAARGGFTLLASVGAGYVPNNDPRFAAIQPLAVLGAGYTWRR